MKRTMFLVVGLCLFSSQAWGISLFDSNYTYETYATYDYDNIGYAKYMSFDKDGNLYITSDSTTNAAVVKITPDGQRSILVDGGDNYQGIVYGEGTVYGDSMFVAEVLNNKIIRLGLNGSRSTFSVLPAQAIGLGLAKDTTGNYGGDMFAGTRNAAGIYRIDEFGTPTVFSSYPLSGDNGISDIAFDPGTAYGGKMFVTVEGNGDYNERGLFKVDTDGTFTRLLGPEYGAGHVKFDNTVGSLFGGGMYASQWQGIVQVAPDGTETVFLGSDEKFISHFIFGPDEAMYILARTPGAQNTDVEIVKITLIPEPASVLLVLAGAGLLRKCKNHR